MGRTFLVTGAAGFIGANLCRRLLADGETVHGIVRPDSDLWRLDGLQGAVPLHRVDITSPGAVAEAFAAIGPQVVYHLATHGAYPFQRDMAQIVLSNVSGMVNVATACASTGVELLVNTGSSSEYGRKSRPMREEDTLEPDSYYAVSKCAQTMLCQTLARQTGLPVVTLRLFSVYGPYEEPSRLVPTIVLRALRAEALEMAAANTARDFVHVDDVVDAYLRVESLMAHAGEVINIGTGVQNSLQDVVDALADAMGRPVEARWGEMAARPWDTSTWVADVSKANRLLGWHPRLDLSSGIGHCIEWFRDHVDLYADRARVRC